MTKENLNHISVDLEFSKFEMVKNTGFARGQCRVAYAGKNRNYSDISKEAFDRAEKTVYGIPVVGNWLGDNFGGHDMIIETKGNEVSFKDSTIPFGFVPQDANPRWESVEDDNGNSKNYYTVDVVLWHERYQEPVQFIIDNGARQSMEIMVEDGEWDDNWEYFNVNEFYYSALCLLGKDEDKDGIKGEKDVEPCFEESSVTVGQFNVSDRFKKDLFAIRDAFEGGGDVGDKDTKKTKNVKEPETDKDIKTNNDKKEVKDVKNPEDTKSYEVEFKEITEKYDLLSEEHDELKIKFEELTAERDELQEYKDAKENEMLKIKKNEIIEDYSLLLTEDEILIAISDKESMSCVEIESELSKAFAMKSLEKAKSKKTNKKDSEVIFEVKPDETTKKKSKFAI